MLWMTRVTHSHQANYPSILPIHCGTSAAPPRHAVDFLPHLTVAHLLLLCFALRNPALSVLRCLAFAALPRLALPDPFLRRASTSTTTTTNSSFSS
jgi:hypothetical protein